uniref:Protein FAM179A n=1 Tax=Anthurium amnicola TaxID=1678845 RepID=A0A1D1XZQ9_9ARAE
MSGKALQDLNTLTFPGLDRKNESSSKGTLTKPYIEHTENLDDGQKKNLVSLACSTLPEDVGSNGIDVANSEVEYIESENLTDLASVDSSCSTLLARLNSKDWVLLCEALNNVRQISIYHKEKLLDMLGDVVSLIVRSLKNPRSAVCKTAIMTSADIFKVYGDQIMDSFDPLLVQLLLKSSQDKKFVCDAAERALIAMTTWVSPSLLLPKLQPYLKNRNPRIRAKASVCFCRSVPLLGIEGIRAYGIDKLIQMAASQISDQLPESREAARTLTLELRAAFDKSQTQQTDEVEQSMPGDSWEEFCRSKLSPLSAQAVLRVTSVGH